MRPVKDFCGNWNPERRAIQFKWDVSGMENDRFIYIVGLQEADGRWKPDLSKQHLFDICDMKNISQSSTFMPIASLGVGVYKMRFCAFSMPQATAYSDEDIQNACASDPAFSTEVMLGRANVVYVAESTVAENATATLQKACLAIGIESTTAKSSMLFRKASAEARPLFRRS